MFSIRIAFLKSIINIFHSIIIGRRGVVRSLTAFCGQDFQNLKKTFASNVIFITKALTSEGRLPILLERQTPLKQHLAQPATNRTMKIVRRLYTSN